VEFGVGGERAEGFGEEVEGAAEVLVEVMPEFFDLAGLCLDAGFELLLPGTDAAEFLFEVFDGAAQAVDGGLFGRCGFLEGGESCGEEFLLLLFELAPEAAEFLVMKFGAVVFEPVAGAEEVFGDLVEDAGGAVAEQDEAVAEGLDGFDGGDPGAVRHGSVLFEVFLDALGFAQEERCLAIGCLDEFAQDLHGVAEFLGEFGVFLVLPGVAQGIEPGLQGGHAVLEFDVEPFEFLGEPADLLRIDDGLCHGRNLVLACPAGRLGVVTPVLVGFATAGN